MYRRRASAVEVLLVHPGGPFFAEKDAGAWSVPKGLVDDGEPELEAARREFREETSLDADADEFLPLGEVRLKSGKVVVAWAFAGDWEAADLRSNTFGLEWPPRSGRRGASPRPTAAPGSGWTRRDPRSTRRRWRCSSGSPHWSKRAESAGGEEGAKRPRESI